MIRLANFTGLRKLISANPKIAKNGPIKIPRIFIELFFKQGLAVKHSDANAVA